MAYIGFNLSEPPFDDVNFRRALAHAIDKETIALRVLLELVVPATGILPPDFPGYNPAVQAPGFDPVKAQELMAQSKYADALRPASSSRYRARAARQGSIWRPS